MSERTQAVTSVGEDARAGWVLTQCADAVEPRVSGFLQRLGKPCSATLTGELPFGPGSMTVEFEVLRP